jgi:hypothetical protein
MRDMGGIRRQCIVTISLKSKPTYENAAVIIRSIHWQESIFWRKTKDEIDPT